MTDDVRATTGGVGEPAAAPVRARARVSTDAPARYGKQLASHLGRRSRVEELDDGHRIHLTAGHADVRVGEGHLLLEAGAPDPTALEVVQRVVGGHLERFGRRAELVVDWQPQAQG